MPLFHQQTKHSFSSVRKNAFFLDWRTQPKSFKTYPHFFPRFNIDEYPALKDLNLIAGITFEKHYPDGDYYLRTVPSAGGLYPCEVYIQLRGIKGMISGIYHYEPHTRQLALIHEIGKDGIESYLPNASKRSGLSFLFSAAYFRSSWKYQDRSIRYILLDTGHQLGSLYAALCVMGRESCVEFDFDKIALNDAFGFRNDEMSLAFLAEKQETTKSNQSITALKQKFTYVAPCDYLEENSFIKDAYKASALYSDKPLYLPSFFLNIPQEQLREAILKRRSIRAFKGEMIEAETLHTITKDLFDFALSHGINIYYTLHRVTKTPQGVYKNGTLLKKGDFQERSKYLSLEQNIGGMSAVTFYFTSSEVTKYQKTTILCGFIAHIIYLRCELLSIGCSGIGAYYDDETKQFLETSDNILYLLAIGR